MIIDLILNRKEGKEYNAKQFYTNVMQYQNITPDASNAIGDAMDCGLNQDVQYELCKYIVDYNYGDIDCNTCNYIRSVNWLE